MVVFKLVEKGVHGLETADDFLTSFGAGSEGEIGFVGGVGGEVLGGNLAAGGFGHYGAGSDWFCAGVRVCSRWYYVSSCSFPCLLSSLSRHNTKMLALNVNALVYLPYDDSSKSLLPRKTGEAKYKTEICRNWLSGHCEFGEKCVFAHGSLELRNKTQGKYKTRLCKQFYQHGYCGYGPRCQFRHGYGQKRLPVFIDLEHRGDCFAN